jgi:type VI secretion system protein
MLLALSVISEQGAALGPTAYKVFDERGGSIGRIAGNDWVLPDPQNFVSSRHARVHGRDGVFYLEDISSNGTFINAPDVPASRTEPVPLKDGDRLFIGDYEIIVQLIADARPSAPAQQSQAAPAPHGAPAQPHGVAAPHAAPAQPHGVQSAHAAPVQPHGSAPMQAAPAAPPSGLGLGTVDPLAALGGGRSQPRVPMPPAPPASAAGDAAYPTAPAACIDALDATVLNAAAAPGAPTAAAGAGVGAGAAGGTAGSGMGELLAALGVDPSRVDPAIQQQLGQILRLTVHGLVEVLKSRAEVKNSFRLPTTSIRPVENNPLKFSMNAEDAIYNLFVKRNPGYLGPVESFQEGFDDVNHHQAAVLAGIRAGFNAMLAKLRPSHLEEVYERKLRRTAMLGLGSKLKYWEMYRAQFEEIDRDREASFQLLFGEEFARAYNEHLQKLAADARLRRNR